MTDTPLIRAARAPTTPAAEQLLDTMAKAAWASEADREAWYRDLLVGGAYSRYGSDGKLRRIDPFDYMRRGDE